MSEKMTTKQIGDFCENAAAEYFEKLHYIIDARQYHTREGEIDIVAHDGECTVFVEVKGRRNSVFGEPCEAVNKAKIAKIIMAAQKYIYEHNIEGEMRFDVVEVWYGIKNGMLEMKRINHYKGAFEEG